MVNLTFGALPLGLKFLRQLEAKLPSSSSCERTSFNTFEEVNWYLGERLAYDCKAKTKRLAYNYKAKTKKNNKG